MSQRDRLIPYVVKMTLDRKAIGTPIEWHKTQSQLDKRTGRPADGKPNDVNLAKWVAIQDASTYPGGVNAHLGITHIATARIVDQRTGETLATYARV